MKRRTYRKEYFAGALLMGLSLLAKTHLSADVEDMELLAKGPFKSFELPNTISGSIDRHSNHTVQIPINSVPVVISQPGDYYLSQDLVYTLTSGSAITVTASGVKIDFQGHSLTLNSDLVTGVYANGVSDLTLLKGSINCASVSLNLNSIGIHTPACNRVKVECMSFNDTRRGIVFGSSTTTPSAADGCEDVSVSNCTFNHPALNLGRGIQTNSVRGCIIDKCSFDHVSRIGIAHVADDSDISITRCEFLNSDNAALADGIVWQNGTALPGAPRNCRVSECTFDNIRQGITGISFVLSQPNQDFLVQKCRITNSNRIAINIRGCENVLVEDCCCESSPIATTNNITVGNFGGQAANRDVIVRNCSFVNNDPFPGFDNCALGGPSPTVNVLFEDCVFDAKGVEDNGYRPANFHSSFALSIPGPVDFGAQDVRVRNCIFKNEPIYNVIIEEPSSFITFECCSFEGAAQSNIKFVGATNCEVISSLIKGAAYNGIEVVKGTLASIDYLSSYNSFRKNKIVSNGAHGILITDESSYNTIEKNNIAGNGGDGVLLTGLSDFNSVNCNTANSNGGAGFNNERGSDNVFNGNRACRNNPNYINVPNIASSAHSARDCENIDCAR